MDNKNNTHHHLPEDDEYKAVNNVEREHEEKLVEKNTNHEKSFSNHIEEEPILTEEVVAIQPIQTKKVGFWIRLWAYLIDVIVVSSINAIILSPVAFFQDASLFQFEYISVIGILSGIVYYMYFLFMTRFFSQTLGKMILGIKVISTEQEKVTWGDLFFREIIGRFIHNAFFIMKFLYLFVAFTDEKKGLHDMIGNTRVVYAKS